MLCCWHWEETGWTQKRCSYKGGDLNTGIYKWDCKAGERFFTVSPDCRFGICQDFPTDKKITDKDFIQVWESESFRERMDAMRRKCAGCFWNCYLDLETLQNLFKDPPVDDLLSTINAFWLLSLWGSETAVEFCVQHLFSWRLPDILAAAIMSSRLRRPISPINWPRTKH